MNPVIRSTTKVGWCLVLLLFIAAPSPSQTAALPDFGYNARRTIGSRPLILIIARFGGTPALAHSTNHYEGLVNNSDPARQNLYAYFSQNSNRRFSLIHLGTIELSFPASDRLLPNPVDDSAGLERIVTAAINTGYPFSQFDSNQDGIVSKEELCILIVSNFVTPFTDGRDLEQNGATRPVDVHPAGTPVRVRLGVASVEHRVNFATLAHEVCHALGHPYDLYFPGHRSFRLTLMADTIGVPEDPKTFHLDPWSKMWLGWSEPRIFDLRQGGVAILRRAQAEAVNAPIILYDASAPFGTFEYFVLEFRQPYSIPGLPDYDASVPGTGLVVWHVQQDLNHNLTALPTGGRAMFTEGAPNLDDGGNQVWTSGAVTPYLTWIDGRQTRTRLFVRPFTANDEVITVEWWSEEETWVEFSYPGLPNFPEVGSQVFPFNSLAEGVGASPWGGFVILKPGSCSERLTINKRVTLEAVGGR